MAEENENKLGLIPLTMLVIGSIIGGGIFNLMTDMANAASLGGVIIGWIVTGIGMGFLVMCFENLNEKRPDLDAGIYSYAKEGFGDYMGFNSAWGYWLSAFLGNVAYATLLFSSIGYFLPIFGNGQNIASVIGASVLLWGVHYLITKGASTASFINTIVTVAKLIPLAIFIVAVILAFKMNMFTADFWGTMSGHFEFGEVMNQVRNSMVVTVWVFIGIEGAVVLSGRAKNRKDVGKATILGLVTVLAIYMLITVLSFGVMSRSGLQHLSQPAMAQLLESLVGKWGAVLVNIGVIISVLGAWLSWTMFSAELPYQAAKDGSFPKLFAKENKNGAPINSLIFTNAIIQVFLFTFLITDKAYNFAYALATSAILIPYALTAFYQTKYSIQEPKGTPNRTRNIMVGVIASIYSIWLIYAGGMKYLLLTMVLFFPGVFIYAWVQKENGKKIFKPYEWVIFAVIAILFAVCIFQMVTGQININNL